MPWREMARPHLDVTNTGASLMRVQVGEEKGWVLPPGAAGSFRFTPGEYLTVYSGKDESAKSKAYRLGAGKKPIRIRAEVNADNPDKIEARYSAFE